MLSNALTLHPRKSLVLIAFSYPRKRSPQHNLTFNNNYTKIPNSVKYLGVLIDKQLSFKCHTDSQEKYLSRNVSVDVKLTNYLSLIFCSNFVLISLVMKFTIITKKRKKPISLNFFDFKGLKCKTKVDTKVY